MEPPIPTITIGSTVINFPASGSSPNWAESIINFAQAVADGLSGIVGIADVSPQVLIIDQYNPGTNISIPNLTFSTTIVRGAIISYAVNRTTSTQEVSETGEMMISYNASNATGFKWTLARTAVGNALIDFAVSDVGQVSFSTQTLTGLSHTGSLSFSAKAILQDN